MNGHHANNDGAFAGTNRRGRVISSFMMLAGFLGSLATARAEVYNFQLQGPNTAADPNSGNVIAMTGSGRFDTCEGVVTANGSFTVYDAEGAVLSKGTWAASEFVSFEPYGGVNRGFQTGLLEMKITLRPKGGLPELGVPMTIICEDGEVPGPAEADSGDGITVGEFSDRIGGFTLFQLIGPDEC